MFALLYTFVISGENRMEKGEDVCEEKVCASCLLVRKEWQCGIFRKIALYLVLRRLSHCGLKIFHRAEVAEQKNV